MIMVKEKCDIERGRKERMKEVRRELMKGREGEEECG